MKKVLVPGTLMLLLLHVLMSAAFAETLQPSPKLKGVTQPTITQQPMLKQRLVVACPDPAAVAIDFQIVNRVNFKAQAVITGTVKNVGTAAYESGPNQQAAYLYEVPMGGTPRLVANQAFQNLSPGQAINVVYRRQWDASSPSEGEFPPSYRLMISYDPDIRMDGNAKNGDCNAGNNQKERSGVDINALFH